MKDIFVKIKNKRGATLMETIINIYVYTILILVCLTVSISYIRARAHINKVQVAVEELSLTMNEMAKKIRMSNCANQDPAYTPFGFSINRCILQGDIGNVAWNVLNIKLNGGGNFDYNILRVGNQTSLVADGNTSLVMEDVGGLISASNTDYGENPLITIKLWKTEKGTLDKIPGTEIQTSVSMRSGYQVRVPTP